MQLLTLHKIMIAASIVMCLLFAAWAGREFAVKDSPAHLGFAVLAVAGAGALAMYLRYFVRKIRKNAK